MKKEAAKQMSVGMGLSLEQSQKLILTPELRQAIHILQLSAVELTEYIETEITENPVLDLNEDIGDESIRKEDKDRKTESEIDWKEYYHDEYPSMGGTSGKEDFNYENMVTTAPTLQEHLFAQMGFCYFTTYELSVAKYLIGSIDDAGYVTCNLNEVSTKFNMTLPRLESILRTIQTLDPTGVGARNLEECLTLQLKELRLNKNKLLMDVVNNHLADLADGKIKQIAKKLGVSVELVQGAADVIRTLEPKPGRRFSRTDDVRYIVPDVVIEKVDDDYVVLVNDSIVPRLRINSTYMSVLTSSDNDSTKSFVENKLTRATWLIRSIEQRRLTLYKVANCLVELQTDFLKHGIRQLKPLNLNQVADIVGVHESTISRAIANKYIQTPQGIFEMKYFFSSGVNSSEGTMLASESVKKMITELIDKENPKKPLSDQKIADLLKGKGIEVSRRTVAKYRDALGIAATSRRKRY